MARLDHTLTAAAAAAKLRASFKAADTNGSGSIDAAELTAVVRGYYAAEGKSRSTKAVQREVTSLCLCVSLCLTLPHCDSLSLCLTVYRWLTVIHSHTASL